MILSFAPARRLVLTALAAAVLLPQIAAAQTPVNEANALYGTIRQANRSDLILLPAVAQMTAPPTAVSDPEKAMLLPATSSTFQGARDWAGAEPQQAVLEALKNAARSQSRMEMKGFGQPYGVDALATSSEGIALIRAGLYTDLGDPPLLASARFLYLPHLENVAALVHVEATRRAYEGDVEGAINVMLDWLFFSRQMADREFYKEARWGLRQMVSALERIRDIAYQDSRGARRLTVDQIMVILEHLRSDAGDLNCDRMSFPRADKIGADQVIDQTFVRRGSPNNQFAPTLARISSHQHPLRLFGEAAAWEQYAKLHADWFDSKEQVNRVYNDWAQRWPLGAFDPVQNARTAFSYTSRTRFAAVHAVLPDMHVLMNDRQVVRAHVAGTQMALGILGFQYRNGNFPPDISAIRPRFVPVILPDPFNPSRSRLPLEYFVPIRDQRFGPREEPRPHVVNVITRDGQYNFQVRLGQDQFILYSVGPDGLKDWATIVYDEPTKDATGDLLLWPPAVSLLRQRLVETNVLK